MTPAKFSLESIEIEMGKNHAPAFGQAHAINEAGMIGAVGKNNVVRTEYGAQQPDICCIARSEIERGLGANPFCKFLLDQRPSFVMSGQKTRSGGRDASRLSDRVENGLFHARI